MLKRLFKEYKERIKQEPFRQAAIIAAVLIILTSFFIHQYIPPVISWSLIAVCLVIIITSEKWNILFFISCIVAGIFLCIPFWLESPQNYAFISDVLKTLMTSDYKSTYGESIGSLIGTFLAIFGALWTQHYFEQEQERKKEVELATIVFYDLKFAFTEVKEIMDKCFSDNSDKTKFDSFKLSLKFSDYRILIDYKWISNVARLSNKFSSEDIETIYYIYGLINSINQEIVAKNSKLTDKLTTFYQIAPQNSPWDDKLKYQHEQVKKVYQTLEEESKKREK